MRSSRSDCLLVPRLTPRSRIIWGLLPLFTHYIYISPVSSSILFGVLASARKQKNHRLVPGYGFVSENEKFPKVCAENNIAFCGPRSDSMKDFGYKSNARDVCVKVGQLLFCSLLSLQKARCKVLQKSINLRFCFRPRFSIGRLE